MVLETNYLTKLKIILQSKILWLILLIFLVAYVIGNVYLKKYSSLYPNDVTKITGRVEKFKIDGEKVSITLKTKELVIASYYANSAEEKRFLENNLKVGSYVILEGERQEIKEPTIFHTFNYSKYLYNNHIYLSFKASKIGIDNTHLSLINKIKDYLAKRMDRIDQKGYVKAFILGNKDELDVQINNLIQENGISHLFALSGMHVNFIWAFFQKIKLNKWLIWLFLIFYFFLAGCPVSFLRALLFMFLMQLNKKLKLGLNNFQILFLTAFLVILNDAFIIFNSAFLYTFVVTFSLLLYSRFTKVTNYLANTFLVSIVTFLFSLPITVANNYEINLLSPLFNIVMVPLVSLFVFPLTLLVFLMPFLNSLYTLTISGLEIMNVFFNNISINWIIGKIYLSEIVIYYFLLIAFLVNSKKTFLILFLGTISFMHFKYKLPSSLEIVYLDVGQGDSSVLIFPHQEKVIMIDTGGQISYPKEPYQVRQKEYHVSDNIITFLKSQGISHIDYLILTHGDYDHAGESLNLVNNFRVKQVILNNDNFNALEMSLIDVLNQKKIPYYQNISNINLKQSNLYFLNTKLYDNENDNSHVLYFSYLGYQFLFMGDASIKRETDILNKYNLSNITFLKVGHHGSKTSSSQEFINKIKVEYAIISVGQNNRYGHPNTEVLNNLAQSQIYRTDLNGSIMLKIKKNRLRIITCLNSNI